MNKILDYLLIWTICLTFGSSVVSADIWVNGYYKDNGTYVEGYWRSSPDSDPTNNYSYPGNINPYTDKVAPGNPNTYLNNYYKAPTTGSTLNSIKEAQDKLKKENEALQKSIDTSTLKTRLDTISSQINQLKQQGLTDPCSALLSSSYSTSLSCSDSQYQQILSEKELAKSRASSLLYTQGLAGNQEVRATRMAEIDAQYDPQLNSCRSLQTYSTSASQAYDQCRANQNNSQAEAQKLQREYQQTNDALGRATRLAACVDYLGKNALTSKNAEAYNLNQCVCADGSELVGGKCTDTAIYHDQEIEASETQKSSVYGRLTKEHYDEICREINPNWVYSGQPIQKTGGKLCIPAESSNPQVIPSHQEILNQIKKDKQKNSAPKVIASSTSEIATSTTEKEKSIVIEVSSTTEQIAKPEITKNKETTLQRISKWLRNIFGR